MGIDRAIDAAMKNQRCQPPAPARKLNAAPVLYTSTRLKKGVTVNSSPGANARVIHIFVAKSATTMARLKPSQRAQRLPASGMTPLLSRPVEVRRAARANRGMAGDGSDIGAIVPAALALGVRAHRDFHGDAVRLRLANARLGSDQREAQVVAERSHDGEIRGGNVQRDFGLQRRAERGRGAAPLDALLGGGAALGQPRSPGD